MTNASTHDVRRRGAILSRLLVVLALVLFGLPQGFADGTLAHADPVAQSKVEQAQGILSEPRHLLRAQFPDDDSPDMLAPGAGDQTRQLLFAAAISPASHLSLLPVAIRILPPVRGPPAV
jgi:cell division protein FtsB